MQIIVDISGDYGCKRCLFNKLHRKDGLITRYCLVTGTKMEADQIPAIIRGATLINCPKERRVQVKDLINIIVKKYT